MRRASGTAPTASFRGLGVEPRSGLDRRAFLVGASAAALGVVAGLPAQAATAGTPVRLDLRGVPRVLVYEAPLASPTVLQSFAFDTANDRLFTAQLLAGTPGTSGDLCLTHLGPDGAVRGSMVLRGAGHGVAFAAESVGTETFLWTETAANANGYGTRLARFPWRDGVEYVAGDPALALVNLVPEALETTCSIDPVHGRLVVRYHTLAGKRFAVFRLADAVRAAQNQVAPERVADFPQPPGLGTFQGYALLGDVVYVYDGNAYGSTNPPPGNAFLGAVDVASGRLVERRLVMAADELPFREPEGLAIGRLPGGKPFLGLGFASGVAGDRRATILALSKAL